MIKQAPQLRRRTRATLAITSIDFTKLWTTLEHDLIQVLVDPFNAKLKNDTEKLHNIVYKLSTGQCFNLPDNCILAQNPHSTSIPQNGDIQPHTLYFMLKRLISNYLKQLISKLNSLSGISLLRQYFTCWNNYLIACDFMTKVFHYLNSDWIGEQESKRKSKNIQSENRSENLLHNIVHFSESSYVCNTKLTCLLLWREWFFERCKLSKSLIDNEVDSLLQEFAFDKFNFYDSIMKIIEMDRNYNYPHSKNSYPVVDEFYYILKTVIESLVYLSLDYEEDYYFNVKYKYYPSMKMFESPIIHIGDYYMNILDQSKTNKTYYPIFYLYDFERIFLESSKQYYCTEIDSLLTSYLSKDNQPDSIKRYLQHTLVRLDHETNKNILHYIPLITRDTIQKIMCDIFIEGIKEGISSLSFILSDVEVWLDNPEYYRENLELLYKVVIKSTRKQAIHDLGVNVRKRIFISLNSDMRKVKMISQDTYDPIQFIDVIIENYNRYNSIIRQIFSNNYELNICKDKTFKEFFNNAPIFTTDPNIKCAEYLSRYINYLLKGSNRPAHSYYSDNLDIESRMDYSVSLCQLLNDVDVFIQYYKVLLAKRLLIFKYEGETTQEELEYTMLTKLKKVCTFGHIYKIQTMLNDLNNAKSLAERFKKFEKESNKVQFTTKVLTKGFWPLNNSSLVMPSNNFLIPIIINERMSSFTEFYMNQYSGRHLTWLNILSKGIVRAHFNNSSMPYYDITVSLVQLSVILQFNYGNSSKTVQELSNAIGIPVAELIQTLAPIVTIKIFDCSSANMDQNTLISVNESFNHNKNKITLFQHSIKQYYEDGGKSNPTNEKILAQIKEDRRYTLQAAIVRILKARKQIEHKQLINLLISQLSSNFKPTNSDVKRAIDSLLQQEYIKRVSEDSNWYQYLA